MHVKEGLVKSLDHAPVDADPPAAVVQLLSDPLKAAA
jgi:hypothetical protein